MKNLSNFNSFVQTINEAAPWDPKKAQTAIDELIKKNKDAEPTGLSFANIQKVYGKNDYATRFRIAQALLLAGKNFFPINKQRSDAGQGNNEEMWGGTGYIVTYYIGEKDQNLKMDKFSEALLRAVKPIIDTLPIDDPGILFRRDSLKNPVVKQAKVAVDKIPG